MQAVRVLAGNLIGKPSQAESIVKYSRWSDTIGGHLPADGQTAAAVRAGRIERQLAHLHIFNVSWPGSILLAPM
jgi:hypothetical protein